jgi:hypothetical protein
MSMDKENLRALVAGQVVSGLLSNDTLVGNDGNIEWGQLVADAVEVANLILAQSTIDK